MILGKYEYSVENNIDISSNELEVLMLLYQPLIGAQAVSVYLSLYSLTIHTTYSDLVSYTDLSMECIERSLISLEKYRLLKTYKHKTSDKYIHVLRKPLEASDVLTHYVYGLELRKILGNHRYNVLVIHYQKTNLIKDEYTDITEHKVFNHHNYEEEDLKAVISAKQDQVLISSQFNFDLFLKDASELKFPSVLRTSENLNYIAELALFYGIHEQRMATLVYRSIDYANMNLVKDRLVDRVRRENVEVTHNTNMYELPNDVFLKSLQNGAAVSDYNKKLLEELAFDMKLNREVINFLIEYIMKTQDNKLVRNYVLQVATTWKAYDVKTIDEAKQLIEQMSTFTREQHLDENKPKIIKRETPKEESSISEEEERAIRERWKKLGEKYGTKEN